MPFIEWRGLSRRFDGKPAVEDFSLAAREGEVIALLGPSGGGKSTLLRLTAGLEEPSAGAIFLDGESLAGVAAHKRGFGLMFQDYCLFPHLSVEKNVEFGLRMSGMDGSDRERRVKEMLGLVKLDGLARRSVLTLSGGEQQRVALARTLAPRPRLLMLDEPLGALDAALRHELLSELAGIISRVGVTTIYVTHDQAEALAIASRIALMRGGRLVQAGTPTELFSRPAGAFCARFLGLGVLAKGQRRHSTRGDELVTDLLTVPDMTRSSREGYVLLIRSGAISWRDAGGFVPARARVVSHVPRPTGLLVRLSLLGHAGNEYAAELTCEGASLPSSGAAELTRPGAEVSVWIDPSKCDVLVDDDTVSA